MSEIVIRNHGPLIVESNWWDSDMARAGMLYCSVNAGCIRLLVPDSRRRIIQEMRDAEYVVLSRGPWPIRGLGEAVELMFEDHGDQPYALQLGPESFDVLPAEPEPGREWVVAGWCTKRGRPHKHLERICHWRRVPRIPWCRPLSNLPTC